MFTQPDRARGVGRGITSMKLSYLRPGEPLVPVVIAVRPWLLVSLLGVVAEHLGVRLQDMVQGVQAVRVPDFLSIR